MATGDALPRLREEAAAEVAALESDLAAVIEASRSSNADDEHDPEGATIAFERAQLIAILAAAKRRVTELDAAAGRLRDGGYGICEVCGRPIPGDRLQARPTARTCVGCAP